MQTKTAAENLAEFIATATLPRFFLVSSGRGYEPCLGRTVYEAKRCAVTVLSARNDGALYTLINEFAQPVCKWRSAPFPREMAIA